MNRTWHIIAARWHLENARFYRTHAPLYSPKLAIIEMELAGEHRACAISAPLEREP